MDRREFLKSLFGVAAMAVVPAPVAAMIEKLEPIVAMPGETSLWSVMVSLDYGSTWTRIPSRATEKEDGSVNISWSSPVSMDEGSIVRIVKNEATTAPDFKITVASASPAFISGVDYTFQ